MDKYQLKLLLSQPFNYLLKLKMWFYSTFYKNIFNGSRNDINKDGFKLTFSDDFDILDRTIWRTDLWWGFRFYTNDITDNNKAPLSYFDDNSFEVNNSILKIKTEHNPIEVNFTDYNGKDYGNYVIPFRTGSLDSSISFMQNKGYFETRCKIPNSINMWPAFWLASKDSWPPEIDIFEVFTNDKFKKSTTTIHWIKNSNKLMSGGGFKTPKLNEDFHIWSCLWDNDNIKIYFDNILVRKTPTPKNFTYDMQIIIGSSPHQNFTENMILPNYMEIDYVRAYVKN
jgi:beta-glucanase (GH16 family)